MIKTNYHTHTELCHHAGGCVEDYAHQAYIKGLSELGMSDHGYLPFCNYLRMTTDEFKNIYLRDIYLARQKYAQSLTIYSGLEVEYNHDYNYVYENYLNLLDYLVLGQHMFNYNGQEVDVYNSIKDEYIIAYADSVIEGMETGYFKFLAHPDIIFFTVSEWSNTANEQSIRIIKKAIELDMPIEYNVNGLRRGTYTNKEGQEHYIYPRSEFWELAAQTNVKVVINDDAHSPDNIDDEYTELARRKAKKLGLNVIEKLDF